MASMGDAQRGSLGGLPKLGEGPRTTSDLGKVGGALTRGPNIGKKLNAAPWSETWPAAGSTLDLDFANNRGWVRGVGQGGVMDAITFTRASVGTFVDQDGIVQDAADNVPRFDWASTEQVAQRNLLNNTENFTIANWGNRRYSTTLDAAIAPDETLSADLFIPNTDNSDHYISKAITVSSGNYYTESIYMKAGGYNYGYLKIQITGGQPTYGVIIDLTNGTAAQIVSTGGATGSYTITDVGSGWYRVSVTVLHQSNAYQFNATAIPAIPASFTAFGDATYAGNGTDGIYLWGAQLELGDTATSYQAIAQPTTSTPLAANPTSNGLLIEGARTNRLLWCRDATDAAWVKTDITAAKDQTGIDGVASAASSLTATADNGTCIQTITLASGSRTGSVYLKRITGTGNVQVSLDGSTYSTVELSASEWRRIALSGTVTNPTVGIKIAVNTDAVAMDYGQVEDGLFVTSPILTTTATATRAVDSTSVAKNLNKYWMNQEQGTLFYEFTFGIIPDTNASISCLSIDNGGNNWFRLSREDGGGNFNRMGTAYRTTISGTINQSLATTLGGISIAVGNVPVKIAVNMQPNNYIFYPSNEIGSFLITNTFPNTVLTKETATVSFPASLNWLKRFVYFPKTTNQNQVQELTT